MKILFLGPKKKSQKKIINFLHKSGEKVFQKSSKLFLKNKHLQSSELIISYGYKYHGKTNNDKGVIFIYDIAEYKDNPDWLNNKNWANPELWEK